MLNFFLILFFQLAIVTIFCNFIFSTCNCYNFDCARIYIPCTILCLWKWNFNPKLICFHLPRDWCLYVVSVYLVSYSSISGIFSLFVKPHMAPTHNQLLIGHEYYFMHICISIQLISFPTYNERIVCTIIIKLFEPRVFPGWNLYRPNHIFCTLLSR